VRDACSEYLHDIVGVVRGVVDFQSSVDEGRTVVQARATSALADSAQHGVDEKLDELRQMYDDLPEFLVLRLGRPSPHRQRLRRTKSLHLGLQCR
jgi:hypothetical protein